MRFVTMLLMVLENSLWGIIALVMGFEFGFIGFIAIAAIYSALLILEIRRDRAPKGRHAGW